MGHDRALPSGLDLARTGGIAIVTIDRPERRNAIDHAMWNAIADLFAGIGDGDGCRVVVIRGAGSDFSAAADISEFEAVRRDAATASAYEASNARAFAAIRNCAVPTIAAIRGICFGGGFGIAAACDLRLAEHGATFSVPAAKLGLAYPVDAMRDIVAACGPQFARYLLFSAARITAQQAMSAGLLVKLTEEGLLERETDEIAQAIARNAPLSIRASKMSIAATLAGDAEMLAAAGRIGADTFSSEDYAEGRAAFRERRPPVFSGR